MLPSGPIPVGFSSHGFGPKTCWAVGGAGFVVTAAGVLVPGFPANSDRIEGTLEAAGAAAAASANGALAADDAAARNAGPAALICRIEAAAERAAGRSV